MSNHQIHADDRLVRAFAQSMERFLLRLEQSHQGPWTPAPVVVAVSGGADSMAMACLFARCDSFGGRPNPWHLTFVQHGLRGAESVEDERFLRASINLWSRFKNPPLSLAIVPGVPATGWPKGSYEAPARTARYTALQSHAAMVGACAIATAHTLEDQAETVLLRLMRGTGLSGLRSIRPIRRPLTQSENVPILRPLLHQKRTQLRQWLASHSIPWREDSSNQLLVPDRNFIRHRILPLLLERWGDRGPVFLARLGREAARWAEIHQRELDRQIQDMEMPRAGRRVVWHLAKAKIKRTNRLADCLHRLWQREHWPMIDWSTVRFRRLAKFIRGRGPLEGMPGGWSIYLDEHVVRFDPPQDIPVKSGGIGITGSATTETGLER